MITPMHTIYRINRAIGFLEKELEMVTLKHYEKVEIIGNEMHSLEMYLRLIDKTVKESKEVEGDGFSSMSVKEVRVVDKLVDEMMYEVQCDFFGWADAGTILSGGYIKNNIPFDVSPNQGLDVFFKEI